jgi:arylsulfatase A-like enzyme
MRRSHASAADPRAEAAARALRAGVALALALSTGACLQSRAGPPSPPPSGPRPNIVLIVADDVGVDMVAAYGEAPDAPCTPGLDALAAGGVLFRNAWANPTCAPTRAQILTGRHGFRTGIGSVATHDNPGLPLEEVILPEILSGYASVALGKWHLANVTQGVDHPVRSGFSEFAGTMGNPMDAPWTIPPCAESHGYFEWVEVAGGVEHCASGYLTSATADAGLEKARSAPEPWFLYVSFHAAHSPLHAPPAELCKGASPPCYCALAAGAERRVQARAMVEALDAELGRMLAGIRADDPDAIVIFVGDNGTAQGISSPMDGCFDPARSKGTLYEGGVSVPLIVNGPDFVPGEITALVSATDLFATVAQLAAVASRAEDSVSLDSYLYGDHTPRRETVYAEFFYPNQIPTPTLVHHRAIRDERFKLIRRTENEVTSDELFDLDADPCELANLHPAVPGTLAHERYERLRRELAAMGVD